MRTLQVLGLAEAGDMLVCKDTSTGELFGLPADERLRAAARGDVSRLGQLEIEMESQLRPRDIQARIRAGATMEEVAAVAGTDLSRIERFAYPVLLERSTIADKAQKARPSTNGVPGRRRIADIVADTLAERGQTDAVSWDAFKDDAGWVLQLRWHAGRTENRAHWLFHPGPDGGSLIARDSTAADLADPAPRPLRTVRVQLDDPPTQEIPKVPAEPPVASDRAGQDLVEQTVTDERSGVTPRSAVQQREQTARTGTDSGRPTRRGSRPAMPSWEDVLLGSKKR